MRIFYQNGIQQEAPNYIDRNDRFSIQELESSSNPYIYPGDSIKYELDGELVSLYDKIRDLFFADTYKYYEQLDSMPIFAQVAYPKFICHT